MNKILLTILLLTGLAFAQVDTIKIPGTEYDTANEIKVALTRATNSLQVSELNDSNYVLTSETTNWDKTASDDVTVTILNDSNYVLTSETTAWDKDGADDFDTLSISWGVMDTVTTGDYVGWKVPNNITVTEVAAFTNTGTATFNLEERAETTPNTAGTDIMTSDLVADSDQQETGTFSNATLDRDDYIALVVTSITGDPTLFGVTVRYVKSN